jgi:predicted nucleic acid-binding protein
MKLLLDASAIIKRYKREIGHDAVARLLMAADVVVLAAHCKVEISSSLSREVHDNSIDMCILAHVCTCDERGSAGFCGL